MTSNIINQLSAKKKFVNALTLTRRNAKYADGKDFLTPIKSKKETPIKSKKASKPRKSRKPRVAAVKVEETVDPGYPIDVDVDVRDDADVLDDVDVVAEIKAEQFNSNDVRRVISLLETGRRKRKDNMPDWAKLASASTHPNNYARNEPSYKTLLQQPVQSETVSDDAEPIYKTTETKNIEYY